MEVMHKLGGKAVKSSQFDLANLSLEAFIECGTSTGGDWKETASLGQTFRVRDVRYNKVLPKGLKGQLEIWKSWGKLEKLDHVGSHFTL